MDTARPSRCVDGERMVDVGGSTFRLSRRFLATLQVHPRWTRRDQAGALTARGRLTSVVRCLGSLRAFGQLFRCTLDQARPSWCVCEERVGIGGPKVRAG